VSTEEDETHTVSLKLALPVGYGPPRVEMVRPSEAARVAQDPVVICGCGSRAGSGSGGSCMCGSKLGGGGG
jgi:hypothetical protein